MMFVAIASFAAAVLVVPIGLYLGLLGLLGRRERAAIYAHPGLKFAFVVPAHDEQAGIASTVASLASVDYPPELRHIFVVADNCSDRTGAVARSAGATVIDRDDPDHAGKGAALEYAFEHILSGTDVDAVVVVDADTVVSPNILTAFAARVLAGAHAVQAEHGVRNIDESWRTRLMTVAQALFHRTRSFARSRLGLSVGLRGNGMCLTRHLLVHCPHQAYGVVEDVEYGIQIGLAGYRVAYAGEAFVLGEMVSRGSAAVSRYRRWEHGRAELARSFVGTLLRRAFARRSLTLLDMAIDLAIPPLSWVAVAILIGLSVDAAVSVALGAPTLGLYLWSVGGAGVLLYVARGFQHSGLGLWRGFTALAYVPVYVGWKIFAVGPHRPRAWLDTQRGAAK